MCIDFIRRKLHSVHVNNFLIFLMTHLLYFVKNYLINPEYSTDLVKRILTAGPDNIYYYVII